MLQNMPQAKDYCDRKISLLKSNFEQLVEVQHGFFILNILPVCYCFLFGASTTNFIFRLLCYYCSSLF